MDDCGHCSCFYTSSGESYDEGPQPGFVYRCCACGKVNRETSESRPWLEVLAELGG